MGSGCCSCLNPKVAILSVDEGAREGFSRQVFPKYEWEVLCAFSQKHGIKQSNLVTVFKAYLSSEDVYLRNFRIKLMDVKTKFLEQTRLMQELVDTFVPSMFIKEFVGLDKPMTAEEVSFSRFVITSYIFCSQQMPDLIHDFLSILKHRFNLPLHVVMFHFNVVGILKLLAEDNTPCAATRIPLNYLSSQSDDKEITLRSVVVLGIKYPILFYSLEHFRIHYKRHVFGDNFWETQKMLKSKITIMGINSFEYKYWFETEEDARRETSISIISDVDSRPEQFPYELTQSFDGRVTKITEECGIKLRNMFGYVATKELILHSELPTLFDPILLGHQALDAEIPEAENLDVGMMGQKVAEKEDYQQQHQQQQEVVSDIDSDNGSGDESVQTDEDGKQNHAGYGAVAEADGKVRGKPEVEKRAVLIYDRVMDRNFKFSDIDGTRLWAQHIVSENGEVVKEVYSG